MAFQKRLEYGFSGYQVPPTPRAARSVRRRCLFKRKPDDQQMCAFDLLATVAGKLLDGGTCRPSAREQPTAGDDTIEKEEDKTSEENSCEQDCHERKFLITELVSEAPAPKFCSNKFSCSQNDVISRPVSRIMASDCSEKDASAELVNDNCKLSLGICTPSLDAESAGFRLSVNCAAEDENKEQTKIDSTSNRNLSVGNKASLSSSLHPEAWDRKPSSLLSSVNNLKVPLSKHPTSRGSFPGNWENVQFCNKDDDEKSFEYTEPSTRNKVFKPPPPPPPPPQAGDHRYRKLLASKPCKIKSDVKDDECYIGDTSRCNYITRKDSFKHQRPMRDYPFKKRKIYDCSSVSNGEEGISSDGICRVPEKLGNESGVCSALSRPGAPASVAVGHASSHSRNAQVKLKIKSFRVPELLIEIPETGTIGSLKRAVVEAVNAVLGEGLCVGVLLQGKKIRDDGKTLLQTGISHDSRVDTLGFTLEPSPRPAPVHLFFDDRHDQLPCESPQPLARYPPPPSMSHTNGQWRDLDNPHFRGTGLNNFIESDRDLASSPPTMPSHKADMESRALVPVPSTKQDLALAAIPLRKYKRSESAQRRIRRPFTVAEVEALVQAVEKLGTGRWRDVKLRAFDSAKHRTYVDLKDKWKTLVHTARISPQQRRGEPVPQELLDRVLTAHAYWSQQQAKQQQAKSPHPDTCLLL